MRNKAFFKITIYFTWCISINTANHKVSAQSGIRSEKINIVDDNALTCIGGTYGNNINGQSFQQDALFSANGWQYVAYYDERRNVCVGRRKLPKGSWQVIRLADYRFSNNRKQDNDTHNTISMGFCANDGTIHLAFDHHGGPLNYRVSVKEVINKPDNVIWEAGLFSPVINYLEIEKPINDITYPAFISTPQGNLLFAYRNGYSSNGDYLIGAYNGLTGKWTDPHVFISGKGDFEDPYDGLSKTRNAYLNNLSYDRNGRLHISWTWREQNKNVGNRDICYAYSNDNGSSWYNTNDRLIASYNSEANTTIDLFSPGITIKNLDRGWGIMNQQAQAVDNHLTPHIVMYHRIKKDVPGWARMNDATYFHYFKEAGSWQQQRIPLMGNRPKLLADKKGSLFLIFVLKDHFEVKYQGAPLVIAKATADKKWTNWTEVYVSKDNYFNEPQIDLVRWSVENVISVMVQKNPEKEGASSELSIIDIKL